LEEDLSAKNGIERGVLFKGHNAFCVLREFAPQNFVQSDLMN
jgi:hypothetical protein